MPCAAKPCLPSHLLLAMYVLVQVSLGEGSWCLPYMATLPAEFPTLELLYLDKFEFMATMPSLARGKRWMLSHANVIRKDVLPAEKDQG